MKTILERAYEYADKVDVQLPLLRGAYLSGAMEQQKIDIEQTCEWIAVQYEGCPDKDDAISDYKDFMGIEEDELSLL